MTNTMTDDRKALIAKIDAHMKNMVVIGTPEFNKDWAHSQTLLQEARQLLSVQPSPDAAQGGECGEVLSDQPREPFESWYTKAINGDADFQIGRAYEDECVWHAHEGWKAGIAWDRQNRPPADAVSSVQDEGMVSVPKDMLELALTYVEAYEPYTESETQMCHAPCKAALQSALSRLASN